MGDAASDGWGGTAGAVVHPAVLCRGCGSSVASANAGPIVRRAAAGLLMGGGDAAASVAKGTSCGRFASFTLDGLRFRGRIVSSARKTSCATPRKSDLSRQKRHATARSLSACAWASAGRRRAAVAQRRSAPRAAACTVSVASIPDRLRATQARASSTKPRSDALRGGSGPRPPTVGRAGWSRWSAVSNARSTRRAPCARAPPVNHRAGAQPEPPHRPARRGGAPKAAGALAQPLRPACRRGAPRPKADRAEAAVAQD